MDCRLPGYSTCHSSALDKLVPLAMELQRWWPDVRHGFKKCWLKLFQRHGDRFRELHCRGIPAESWSHSYTNSNAYADSHPDANAHTNRQRVLPGDSCSPEHSIRPRYYEPGHRDVTAKRDRGQTRSFCRWRLDSNPPQRRPDRLVFRRVSDCLQRAGSHTHSDNGQGLLSSHRCRPEHSIRSGHFQSSHRDITAKRDRGRTRSFGWWRLDWNSPQRRPDRLVFRRVFDRLQRGCSHTHSNAHTDSYTNASARPYTSTKSRIWLCIIYRNRPSQYDAACNADRSKTGKILCHSQNWTPENIGRTSKIWIEGVLEWRCIFLPSRDDVRNVGKRWASLSKEYRRRYFIYRQEQCLYHLSSPGNIMERGFLS